MKTFIFLCIISMILFVGTFARSLTVEEVIQLSTKAKEAKKKQRTVWFIPTNGQHRL